MTLPHALPVRWFVLIILALGLHGTRELLGAQELGGGSAAISTGYDLSGLRVTHSDLLSSGAWSTNAAGETSQARGRPVVNDLLGRVTSLDGWNHTYSCDGLLLSSEPSAPAEGSRRSVHAYDALGRRVRTTTEAYVGGQWTAFSSTERDFIGRLPLGIETSFAGGSAKSWRFLRGPDASGSLEGAGGARGVLAVLKDASSWKAVAADTLGNVLALAGTNGDFTRRTFDPWGNPLVRDASGSLRAATLNERRADYDALPLAWASQEYDPDTGLSHYHFREYSPSLGGWLTRDPIGLAGGYLNLRSYLGNRPADALDVWGEAGAGDIPADGDWSRSSYWTRGFSRDYDYKAAEALIRQVEGNDGIKTAAQLYAEDRETWQGRLTQWICGSTPETFEHMARLRNMDHAEDLLHQLRDQEGYRRFSRQAAVSQVTQPMEAMVSAPIWSIPGPGRVAGAQQLAAGASTRGNTVVQGKDRLLKMQAEVKCPPCKEGTGQVKQMEFAFARGAAVRTPEMTKAGEVFVRVAATEEGTFVRPGSYAIPESVFRELGQDLKLLKNALDLPGGEPLFYRYVYPSVGTPIKRGIVPGGEFGGVGGYPEVIFPNGVR